MTIDTKSPLAISETLGARLKQARLNTNLTQSAVANLAGVSRKLVLNAEKGKVQLEDFVAIMVALNLAEHLENFLPEPEISPIQLAKLKGKMRQRASGQQPTAEEGSPEW